MDDKSNIIQRRNETNESNHTKEGSSRFGDVRILSILLVFFGFAVVFLLWSVLVTFRDDHNAISEIISIIRVTHSTSSSVTRNWFLTGLSSIVALTIGSAMAIIGVWFTFQPNAIYRPHVAIALQICAPFLFIANWKMLTFGAPFRTPHHPMNGFYMLSLYCAAIYLLWFGSVMRKTSGRKTVEETEQGASADG